jgi:hypothetical protein
MGRPKGFVSVLSPLEFLLLQRAFEWFMLLQNSLLLGCSQASGLSSCVVCLPHRLAVSYIFECEFYRVGHSANRGSNP